MSFGSFSQIADPVLIVGGIEVVRNYMGNSGNLTLWAGEIAVSFGLLWMYDTYFDSKKDTMMELGMRASTVVLSLAALNYFGVLSTIEGLIPVGQQSPVVGISLSILAAILALQARSMIGPF